ncbi:hypothetical protein GCM10028801_44650 [Nocardioides maradonensis]
MSDQTPTSPTDEAAAPPSGGAGRWAERAKEAARQRQASHAPAPEPTEEISTNHVDTTHVDPSHVAAEQIAVEPAAETTKRRLFGRGGSAAAVSPATAASVNPFLPGPALEGGPQVQDTSSEERGRGLAAVGFGHTTGPRNPPVAPVPLNPALAVPSSWPSTAGTPSTVVQLVGLHGGAGTSTLAAELGPQAADCGVGLAGLRSVEIPVLFVARTHAHGLDLALRTAQQYAARGLGPITVLGIVVVHDAPGPLSKQLARRLKSVEKAFPNCWTVPWSEDLRHNVALPPVAERGARGRDVRRILKKATELTDRHEPPHRATANNRTI